MLSPTLPSWCDDIGNGEIPPRMLSPTLPPMFDFPKPTSKDRSPHPLSASNDSSKDRRSPSLQPSSQSSSQRQSQSHTNVSLQQSERQPEKRKLTSLDAPITSESRKRRQLEQQTKAKRTVSNGSVSPSVKISSPLFSITKPSESSSTNVSPISKPVKSSKSTGSPSERKQIAGSSKSARNSRISSPALKTNATSKTSSPLLKPISSTSRNVSPQVKSVGLGVVSSKSSSSMLKSNSAPSSKLSPGMRPLSSTSSAKSSPKIKAESSNSKSSPALKPTSSSVKSSPALKPAMNNLSKSSSPALKPSSSGSISSSNSKLANHTGKKVKASSPSLKSGLSNSKGSSPATTSTQHSKSSMLYDAYQALHSRARNVRRRMEASTSRDKQTCVICMDTLFTYIIAYEYYERSEHICARWGDVISFISFTVTLLEENDDRYLVGLCYQIRALIHSRLAQWHRLELTREVDDPSEPDPRDFQRLALDLAASENALQADFRRGLRDLGVDLTMEEFPETWGKRLRSPGLKSKKKKMYRPDQDGFFLPLHVYSTIQESVAFGYAIVTEWCETNEVEHEWMCLDAIKF